MPGELISVAFVPICVTGTNSIEDGSCGFSYRSGNWHTVGSQQLPISSFPNWKKKLG